MKREDKHDSAADDSAAGRDGTRIFPKLLAVVAVIGILRMLASHKRGGHGDRAGWRERRHQMIAEIHRELHREEAAETAAETTAKA
jgi:hypothetical protein